VAEKLKDLTRLLIIYCGEIADDDKRKSYLNFINKLGDRRMRDRVLKDATGEMMIKAVEFDANPYLINCLNGTYDLKDFTFREASWDDFITMQTRFRFILYGKTTRNGKSTLLNTVEYLLGDYAKVAPVGIICKGDRKKDAEAASPTLAGLKGKRFVTMNESDSYGTFDAELLKTLTGGEEISARALYQTAITYKPQFTLWLSCNDLPAVTDQTLFASDRLRVVEFNRHFAKDEQDIHLKEELTTQEAMSGIFMWLVRGYLKYVTEGLKMGGTVSRAVTNYQKENDTILQFLEAQCERDEDGKVKSKDLYTAFKIWAKSEGAYVLSARKFNSEMDRHQDWFEDIYFPRNMKTFVGLKLREVF